MNKNSVALVVGNLGIVLIMMACAAVGGFASDQASLRLEDGAVEVQDGNGDWRPADADSAFELIAELESIDPWVVAGQTIETNESTRIEEELQVGDLVRVRGTILEDGAWLALSIEHVERRTDPVLVLIGVVDSIDPWVVNGITLPVTDDTVITGEITPGMIVRVEILLLSDGTWEVISIAPLGNITEISGCATVLGTVVSVNGDRIQFLGWPTTVILKEDTHNENDNENDDGDESDEGQEDGDEGNDDEQGDDGIVSPGQVVLAVICASDDGTFVIVQIIVLNIDYDSDGNATDGGEKVLVCHKPSKNAHTLSIPSSAVPAHLGHGDTLGPCP